MSEHPRDIPHAVARRVQVRWKGGRGRAFRWIWASEVDVWVAKQTAAGRHDFEWRTATGKRWRPLR